jgi:hypothetical protein
MKRSPKAVKAGAEASGQRLQPAGSRREKLKGRGGGWRRAPEWLLTRRYEFLALGLYAFVLAVRAPWILFSGRIWAEEGTMFLQYAWNHSVLDALIAPHAGYYNLVANTAGIVAAYVPLETAPHFTAGMALLIQLLPAVLVLFTRIPGLTTPFRKAVALLLLLVVPANPEIYLVTINAHFVLCAATGLVLVSEAGGYMDRVFKWLLLGLSGLSGVVSTFLAPLFWLQWWRERQRDRLVQALILTICGVLQAVLIARGVADEERHLRFNPTVVVGAAYAKFVAMPVSPVQPVEIGLERLEERLEAHGRLPAWVWLSTAVVFGLLLLICWRSGSRTAQLLAVAAIWLIVLASPGSREAATDQKLYIHLTGALRYYYAAEVFVFLALLVALDPGARLPKALRIPAGFWLAAVMLMGSFNFARAPLDWPTFFSGPSWPQQVEQWRKDPSKPMALWPVGWQLNLTPKP